MGAAGGDTQIPSEGANVWWWWSLACFLGSPDPEAIARRASVGIAPQVDGISTLSTPERLGALGIWGEDVVFSVPGGLLAVPLAGGPTRLASRLPDDCWPNEVLADGDVLYTPCPRSLVRVRDGRAEALLDGELVAGVALGHGGVYTCRDTRLVRIADDGTWVTLADLGAVPPAEGLAPMAACAGSQIHVHGEHVFVLRPDRGWVVPSEGGPPREVAGGPVLRNGVPLDPKGTLRVPGCPSVDGDVLWTCVDRGTQQTILRSVGAHPPVTVVHTEAPIVAMTGSNQILVWAEGTAGGGGRIRSRARRLD